ncbi:TIGR02253 family HAD-type hydrolase, partial [archaeon]|nr:TIGR02253 family HAD-type hydrolase [archaeon]
SGLPEKSEEKLYNLLDEIIKKHGPNYAKHYDRLLEELGLEHDPKIVAAGVVAYEHTKEGYLKPYPGVVPTLLKLREKYKLGVISNGLSIKQWEKLIGLGIHHLFDVVATSEELGFKKPQKEIFLFAVEKLGLTPADCMMVGNRLDTDILGGNTAGMKTVRLKRGKYKEISPSNKDETPDFEIDDFTQITAVLGPDK